MTANELLDFLAQENMGLRIWGGENEVQFIDYRYREKEFEWFRGSHTVNVCVNDKCVDCFNVRNAILSDVLRGIKEYRKGE